MNLRAAAGELIGIVGANGCGKSTLLQLMAGLRRPEGGSIYLDGQEVKGSAGRSLLLRYTGYVPQTDILIPELNVRDNLLLWYRDKHVLEQQLKDGLLCDLELEAMLCTKAAHLSGGMRKKVSIACAVAGNPPILLLDEPDAALDIVTKERIRRYLVQYQGRGGTILMATHDEADLDICSRIYALRQGVLHEIAATLRGEELIANFL